MRMTKRTTNWFWNVIK